jgi:hypothetical protein
MHAPEGVLRARQGDGLLNLAREVVGLDEMPKLGLALRQTLGSVQSSSSSAAAMKGNQLSS